MTINHGILHFILDQYMVRLGVNDLFVLASEGLQFFCIGKPQTSSYLSPYQESTLLHIFDSAVGDTTTPHH